MIGKIIFSSKYGATRDYAEMLSKSLNLPCIDSGQVSACEIESSDYLILGSPVYVGKLLLRRFIARYAHLLLEKVVFMYIVSGDPETNQAHFSKLIEQNIALPLQSQIRFSFLPGRIVGKNLSWRDSFLLRIGAMLQNDQERKNFMLGEFNGVNQDALSGLIREVKDWEKLVTVTQLVS